MTPKYLLTPLFSPVCATYIPSVQKPSRFGITGLEAHSTHGDGQWTQYSVFECLLTAVQFAKLQTQTEKLIKPKEDSIRIYVLDAGAVKRTIAYGSEKPRQPEAIIL
jgi:CRISPR-associated endonuclease Cas2